MAAVRRMALGEFRWTRHNLHPSAVVRVTVLAADVTVTDGPLAAAPASSASCASLPPSLIWFSKAGRRLLAAVLFRGVDLAIVWPLLAAIGTVYFAFALGRFRRVIFGT
jgi:hypothetical protein